MLEDALKANTEAVLALTAMIQAQSAMKPNPARAANTAGVADPAVIASSKTGTAAQPQASEPVTHVSVGAKVQSAVAKGKRAEVVKLLGDYSVAKASLLPADKLIEFDAKISAILAA